MPQCAQISDTGTIGSFREVNACPACSAVGARAVGSSAPGWNEEVSGKVFRHPEYEVRYCDACGLYFKSHVFTDEALSEHYRVLPFETFESRELFPTDRLILNTIASAEPGAKVLDFGCGVGRILGHLTGRHCCYGVELNARSSEAAKAKGIMILPESAVTSRAEDDFDFVILSDVFEHLPNPLPCLRMLREALAPSGALIISTGNGDAVRCEEYLSQFWYFRALGHLQMLSPKHLRWCATQLNLTLTDCSATSHYITPLLHQFRQHVQTWAFQQFHLRPRAWFTRVARLLPRIRCAEHWPVPPAITCTPDHLVAVLRNPPRACVCHRAGMDFRRSHSFNFQKTFDDLFRKEPSG